MSIPREDRTTAIGKMIDSYLVQQSELDDRAIHLLFSANRWEARQGIVTCLESGKNIVCDRYAFSGIAYSCAKVRGRPLLAMLSLHTDSPADVKRTQGLSYQWCKAPDVGLPEPDVTIFLDLSVEEASRRGGYGEERYESVSMQSKVREAFAQIRKDMPQGKWVVVDAGKSVDEVAAECESVVRSLAKPSSASLAPLFAQQ
ncbi:hypothetical protein L7F22_010523 [Adiantum nelumboides]|nr:hypothetical protein [Adiantum nelumboides]